MSKKATEFQKREMSKMYRGKEIFKPLNTGWVDERVACVREWVANIFFYRKGDTTIMIDAGYHYDRLDGQFRIRLRPQGPALLPIQKTRPRPRRLLRRLRRVRRHAGAGESRPAEGRGPVKHRGQLVINTTSVGADDSVGPKMLQI